MKMLLTALRNVQNSDRSSDFWDQKLSNEFPMNPIDVASASKPSVSYTIFGKKIKTYNDLEFALVSEYETLLRTREDMTQKLKELNEAEQKSAERVGMVQRAAQCHLRDKNLLGYSEQRHVSSCEVCMNDQAFRAYARCLFGAANHDDAFKADAQTTDSSDEETEQHTRPLMMVNMNKERNDFDKLIKLLIAQTVRQNIYSFIKHS